MHAFSFVYLQGQRSSSSDGPVVCEQRTAFMTACLYHYYMTDCLDCSDNEYEYLIVWLFEITTSYATLFSSLGTFDHKDA